MLFIYTQPILFVCIHPASVLGQCYLYTPGQCFLYTPVQSTNWNNVELYCIYSIHLANTHIGTMLSITGEEINHCFNLDLILRMVVLLLGNALKDKTNANVTKTTAQQTGINEHRGKLQTKSVPGCRQTCSILYREIAYHIAVMIRCFFILPARLSILCQHTWPT